MPLSVFEENEKYGLKNATGIHLTTAKYNRIEIYDDFVCALYAKNELGEIHYIDHSGDIIANLNDMPINSLEVALKRISNGIDELSKDIKQRLPGANNTPQSSGGTLSKPVIWKDNALIKLEVNTVLRGSIFEPTEMELSSRLQNEFKRFVAVQVLSKSDLYGGKLCAALDRQHPGELTKA
ncbi:nucleotidyl transferase AbiEii/AbiGii toxin family protein [Gracilimonas sp.]|uniref:nucleotidyl transferase AbiEii/AbiGii toxin family protein n=1 Tax=Gracilimonas sp. TaxID=1974203 RepID=UPI003D09C1B4